jgi:hypothetical protein
MSGPIDAYYFSDQAKKCRRLARGADDRTRKALLELADEFAAKAIALDESG